MKRWMNLNRITKNSMIIKIQKSAIPANPHHICCVKFFYRIGIFFTNSPKLLLAFFSIFEFFAMFSFLLTWRNILWNLKNGIKLTQRRSMSFFDAISFHTDCFINISKLWKNSLNNPKMQILFILNRLTLKMQKN